MVIEHLDPFEVNMKEQALEIENLKRLEKQLKAVEKEKIKLLSNENKSEVNLIYNSALHGLDL
jgi:hypothetical protein